MKLSRFITIVDMQARASLKAEASKLQLSHIWWVLEPLLFVAVFYVVFSFFLKTGTENFVFFLMCGKVPFLWLSKTVTQASSSILENKGLIASTRINKIIFPYVVVQEIVYKQWVVFLLLFTMAFYFGSTPSALWVWLLPILLTNYLLIVGLSLACALITTFFHDFKIVISMGMLLLMFVSGIFWDINNIQDEYWRNILITVNPLAFLIESYRDVLMYKQTPNVFHLSSLALITATSIFAMHIVFGKTNSNITQRVLQS